MTPRQTHLAFLITLSFLASAKLPVARAFIIFPGVNHWLTTASGTRTGNGEPVTLTWSIVPDGTPIIGFNAFGGTINYGPSDLVSSFGLVFGTDPNSSAPEDQPWFHFFADAFGRWSELSGATYTYEPNDDGVTINTSSGALGVRGDLRIGGAEVDGASNILAFNTFPNNGDMVLDTDDGDFFSNATNGYRALRNTIMHEHGHGFGVRHVASTTDQLLMETAINLAFDGPQLDEVRAIQYYFGDANEKSNGGLGNDTTALATSLGTITPGSMVSVGADADVPTQFILPTTTDFVSIANLADTDFFSFSVSQASRLSAVLTPRGGQFTQAQPVAEGGDTPTLFNASARSDLTLAIFDTNGTSMLDLANNTGLGGIETLADLELSEPGEYFARVTGGDDTIQLYELELSVLALYAADFDGDGDVDATDLGIWDAAYGTSDLGDADDDGDSDGADFLAWQEQYTGDLSPPLASSRAVPEPTSALLAVLGGLVLIRRGRRVAPTKLRIPLSLPALRLPLSALAHRILHAK